jgi:hypothetical protein
MNCPCGKKLKGKQTKYCSRECNGRSRQFAGHNYIKKINGIDCGYCGTHVPKPHGNQNYCNRDCQIKAEVERRAAPNPNRGVDSICPMCRKPHKGESKWQYCSICKPRVAKGFLPDSNDNCKVFANESRHGGVV